MSDVAISAENLSKLYRIGVRLDQQTSFMGKVLSTLSSPVRNFKSLRSLDTSRAHLNGDQEDEGLIWALRDVSFEVKRGEVLGIIGRNGAGKSTLLKILSRVTEPTSGRVRMRGRVAALLEVGTGFNPDLTGRENIYLNGTILGMRKAEIDRKFDEIVEFSGVEKFLDTPVKRYSSGMRVRLGFAVAAHLEPEILIVDEVLAVGDAEFQRRCLGKMRTITQGGDRTVLFVSHNLTTVASLCSRAIWMKSGEVVEDGPSGDVVEKYLAADFSSSGNEFHVSDLERNTPRAGELIRISQVTFNDGRPIRHGEPLVIRMAYDCQRSVSGVSFNIAFDSLSGGRVLSVDSDIPGDRFEIEGPSEGWIEMTVPQWHLQPGNYLVSAALRSGDNLGLDQIGQFKTVQVLPGPSTPSVIVGRASSGGVRVPAVIRARLGETKALAGKSI